jgi:hypothetical protein
MGWTLDKLSVDSFIQSHGLSDYVLANLPARKLRVRPDGQFVQTPASDGFFDLYWLEQYLIRHREVTSRCDLNFYFQISDQELKDLCKTVDRFGYRAQASDDSVILYRK